VPSGPLSQNGGDRPSGEKTTRHRPRRLQLTRGDQRKRNRQEEEGQSTRAGGKGIIKKERKKVVPSTKRGEGHKTTKIPRRGRKRERPVIHRRRGRNRVRKKLKASQLREPVYGGRSRANTRGTRQGKWKQGTEVHEGRSKLPNR